MADEDDDDDGHLSAAPATEFRCLSPLVWRFGWIHVFVLMAAAGGLVGIVGAARVAPLSWPVVGYIAVLIAGAALYNWPSRVTIEEDGVRIRALGLTSVLGYGAIAKIEKLQRLGPGQMKHTDDRPTEWTVFTAVRITLHDGSRFDITTGTQTVETRRGQTFHLGATGDFGAYDRQGDRMVAEIEARRREIRWRPAPTRSATIDGLRRGARSVAEWRASLRARAGQGPCDPYRATELPAEALWRVLEDEVAPRDARAAAAILLRDRLDDAGRERLRVAATTCASPKLRVVVEATLDAEADDERLEQALAQASPPSTGSAPRS